MLEPIETRTGPEAVGMGLGRAPSAADTAAKTARAAGRSRSKLVRSGDPTQTWAGGHAGAWVGHLDGGAAQEAFMGDS